MFNTEPDLHCDVELLLLCCGGLWWPRRPYRWSTSGCSIHEGEELIPCAVYVWCRGTRVGFGLLLILLIDPLGSGHRISFYSFKYELSLSGSVHEIMEEQDNLLDFFLTSCLQLSYMGLPKSSDTLPTPI